MDSQDNINNLRVASFSAYLTSTEEKLTRGIQGPMPEIISPPKNPGRPSDEGEISVFGADKYFNMRIDDETTPKVLIDNSRMKKEDQADQLRDMKPKLKTLTPSVCSEASWNSQAAALSPNLLRNPTRNKQKKAIGKRFFAGFGCNGPCLDKISVHINEGIRRGLRKESLRSVNPVLFDGTKESQSGLRGGENFAFPILKPLEENLIVKKQLEEQPRYSIEVFGSHSIKKDDIAMNLERKLSVLTWDAIPKAQNLPLTLGSGGLCDDFQSDASSDLFEIETVSGTGHSLLTMQASELTTQYGPSEASIKWSVVTASAADFSVVSDYDEKSVAGDRKSVGTMGKLAKPNNIACKEGQKTRPGGLLGCKTHKSVSVVETAYRTTEKAKDPLPPNLSVPLSRNIDRH